MTSSVPVVDFSPYKLGTDPNTNVTEMAKLVEDMYKAFTSVGFVYLKNHGIPDEVIKKAYAKTSDFFSLSPEVKRQYARPPGLKNHGWVQTGREQVVANRPGDYKEVFDVNPSVAECWPANDLVDGFKDAVEELYYRGRNLGRRIMRVLAMGLGLQDVDFFIKYHNKDKMTYTALRCLYYPIIGKESDLQENQIRCGEHTDYGTLTMLFQDDAGGLEVFDRDSNSFMPAPPIPGTIVINLGDLMQRWTSDKLVSTKHRVVNPDFGNNPKKIRRSMACIVHPDAECIVECFDGTNKYPPIKAKDYLHKRYTMTYRY